MNTLIISFVISLLITFWIVRFSHLHIKFTADCDIGGIQKFHLVPVPRIGGVGVFIGVLFSLCALYVQAPHSAQLGLFLLISALPAFIVGLVEDLTKCISAGSRLLATMASAFIAGSLNNFWLLGLGIPGLDGLMFSFPSIAILVTCFSVGGVANAFNLIDGYNGLSSMVAVIILTGIAYVAFKVNDISIVLISVSMVGGLLGFLVWNYPNGHIFLGDGGAYFIGFWIAEIGILLVTKHPEVSVWFPMLLCIYPIFETLFTIYRRLIILRSNVGAPDATHLHQLIYKRLVKWTMKGDVGVRCSTQRNAITASYLWVLSLLGVIPAVFFWDNTLLLQIFSISFCILYIFLYNLIVRFHAPKFLIIRKN